MPTMSTTPSSVQEATQQDKQSLTSSTPVAWLIEMSDAAPAVFAAS